MGLDEAGVGTSPTLERPICRCAGLEVGGGGTGLTFPEAMPALLALLLLLAGPFCSQERPSRSSMSANERM